MNRTIEQWQKVDCEHVAKNASPAHVMYLLQDAVRDLQELARQLETERTAWSAKRAELLRNNAAELVRRKHAEAQRDELLARVGAAEAKLDYALNKLEFIANTNDIDAALDPDRAIRVAKAALKFIKEQTK